MTAIIREYTDNLTKTGMNNPRATDHIFNSLAAMRRVCLETYDSEGVAYCENKIKELIAHVKAR